MNPKKGRERREVKGKRKKEKDLRPSNGLRINLTQPYAPNLPLLDQLRQNTHRLFNSGVRILSRALKDINLLPPRQQPETFIHTAPDIRLGAIGNKLAGLEATFDTENNLVCVLGVFCEVFVE
jgi:hypothetical protein